MVSYLPEETGLAHKPPLAALEATTSDQDLPGPSSAVPSGHRVAVKLLVSNAAAGSIIGKGGACISELQQSSNSRIQLSQASDHFPGTSDRMLLVTGGIGDVLTALHLMFTKLNQDGMMLRANGPPVEGGTETPTLQVRVVVPSTSCGALIGKGGANIKHISSDSGAQISVSVIEQQFPGVHERIVTISGQLEQQLRAIALILSKISEEPGYDPSTIPMSYSMPHPAIMLGSPGLYGAPRGVLASVPTTNGHPITLGSISAHPGQPFVPRGPMGGGHPAHLPHAGHQHTNGRGGVLAQGQPVVAGMVDKIGGIADEHVGIVVGKGGRTLAELQQTTGVRIGISNRGEFLPGTTQRMLTLTGHPHSIALLEKMIEAKIHAVTVTNGSSGAAPQQQSHQHR